MVAAMTDEMFFDYLAVRIDGLKAQALDVRIAWRFSDTQRDYALTLKHGALTCSRTPHATAPHVTVTMTRGTLNRILNGETGFADAVRDGGIHLDGDAAAFTTMLGMLDSFKSNFNIVEP